jgi:hypothetical protein
MFYLDVAYVLQRFSSVYVFFQVFHAYFKYFICLQMYVVNISSECFKIRSGVAHVVMAPVAGDNGLPQGFSSYLAPSSRSAPRPLLESI